MHKPQLPMPNEVFGAEGATVIASCWQNDDHEYGPLTATLLLLTQNAPYYLIYDVTNFGDGWFVNCSWDRDNIIPAAELYSELIGGY